MRSLLIAVSALLCLAGCTANPFRPDDENVGTIDFGTYADLISRPGDERSFSVMILLTSPDEQRCPMCPYAAKQFRDFAQAWAAQSTRNDTYTPGDSPLYFVEAAPSALPRISAENRVNRLPSIVGFRAGSKKSVKFGEFPIDDSLSRKKLDSETKLQGERDKANKGKKSYNRMNLRASRRKRGLTTQEETEYPKFGTSNYDQFTMNNICKWSTAYLDAMIRTCPQDTPMDFQQKKKGSETGKNLLVLGVMLSAGGIFARIFGFIFPFFNANKVDIRSAMRRAMSIKEEGDEHETDAVKNMGEQVITTLGFVGCVVIYALLTGGMYWNILNNVPWSGTGSLIAAGQRQQYGAESVLLAMLNITACTAMVGAGFFARPINKFFERKYFVLPRLDVSQRSYVKLGGGIACFFVWYMAFTFLLRVFRQKSPHYLAGYRTTFF